MATQTPNIGLTLPIGTEHLSRSIVNNNNTIIDTKMGAVGNTDLQTQVNNLNTGKVNTSDIANNLTTTTAGKVLDARQGKALSDQMANLGTYTQLLGSTSTTGEQTLSDSYQNYRYILLVLFGSNSRIYTAFIPSTLLLPSGYRLTIIGDSNNAGIVKFVSNTTVDIISTPDNIRIYGIK